MLRPFGTLGSPLARQVPTLTPEEEASLAAALARRSIGAIAGAANILGTPGAMVNRALMGENPLMPLLSPWSGEYHKFGRDVLRHHNLIGRQDNWGNFAGGLAVDVATNPFTWWNPASSALTQAGTLAKKAGLMQYVGRPIAGAARKSLGRAVGRQTQTIADLFTTSIPRAQWKDSLRNLRDAARLAGIDRQAQRKLMRGEALGGWGGLGMPLLSKTPVALFGGKAFAGTTGGPLATPIGRKLAEPLRAIAGEAPGPIAANIARAKDIAGYAIRTSPPGRAISQLLSSTGMGSAQEAIQAAGHRHQTGQYSAQALSRRSGIDFARKMEAAGLDAREIRRLGEAKGRAGRERLIRDLVSQGKPEAEVREFSR
jgi:hypothetical protein